MAEPLWAIERSIYGGATEESWRIFGRVLLPGWDVPEAGIGSSRLVIILSVTFEFMPVSPFISKIT